MAHNAKKDRNRTYYFFPTKQWKEPTDSTAKKTRKRDRLSGYFLSKSASASFVYNGNIATRADSEISDKEYPWSLSAIPVSRVRRRSVSSVGNQGHHFRKIGESKTESIL